MVALGQPRAEGSWTTRLNIHPSISISHSHGTAVALAASGRGSLVGIDFEHLARQRADYEPIAFSPEGQPICCPNDLLIQAYIQGVAAMKPDTGDVVRVTPR